MVTQTAAGTKPFMDSPFWHLSRIRVGEISGGINAK
jgi:hypothetical protein